MTKIKPCPFCGSKAEIHHNRDYDEDGAVVGGYYFGRCVNTICPKKFVYFVYDTHRKAVRAWNRRAK